MPGWYSCANLSEIVRAGMRSLMENDRARRVSLLEQVRAEASGHAASDIETLR